MRAPDLLYLSRADVEALAIRPADLVDAVERVFRAKVEGRAQGTHKTTLYPGEGRLQQTMSRLAPDHLVGVVMASRGYPESSQSGCPIEGIADAEQIPGVAVFHAGTALRDGQLVTAGGRVLTVVGIGSDFEEAIRLAYAGVEKISFDGMQYRRDIGRKALTR